MNVRFCITILTCLVLALGLAEPASAQGRDVVSASFTTKNVDLGAVLERIETENAEVRIPLPVDEAGNVGAMVAVARNFALRHRWAVFSLQNKDTNPKDLVVTTNWQGFAGSGLIWPRFASRKMLSVQSSPGLQPVQLEQKGGDAYAFRINPGATVTYAIEVSPAGIGNLTLWKRAAHAAHRQDVSTFQGMLMGFALLISIAVICLFIIRPQWAFPAAALFAWPATAFLALEFGYAGVLNTMLADVPNLGEKAKAIAEGLMTAGLLACILAFLELPRRMALMAGIVALVFLAALGLSTWAWFRPDIAAGAARMGFAASAIAAVLFSLMLTSKGALRARASLFFFVAALLWATGAAIAVFERDSSGQLQFMVTCGLVLVMGVMSLVLARFAFSRGVIHSKFFEDSGRRALALAGSEQAVWDWQEDQGALYVGPELERALGVQQGKLTRGGLKSWLALIHPDDRAGYVAAVEAAVDRGRGAFNYSFRLRRADDSYRWYELRARAMPGQESRAMRCIGTLTDITATKRAEDSLLFNAVHDRVTNLPNRALFLDRLDGAVRRAAEAESSGLHVLVIDLDRFKNMNDSLGNNAGDQMLMATAGRLRHIAGPDDTLARLSGDRFGLIADLDAPARSVEELTDAIRTHLSDPVEIEAREVTLTACIGVAAFRPEAANAETLLKDAEIALYEAKRRGKSKAELFDSSMSDDRSALIDLEAELRRAVRRDEMEVLYQPITRLEDEELAGFEALIRWRHPERGLLMPEEFISIAEENGLIEDLGRFVLNEAARQLGIWQRAFRPKEPLFVSINMSHAELLGRGVVDEVQALLNREDIEPGTLKIEITESMVMQNPALSIQVLQRLKSLGVSLACDDFGTGYSSLATLQRLPFDVLKLDKSFLEAGPEDETAATILETIIELAGKLDMVVVAEGVEESAQADRLRELGCELAQGYYYGEPMTTRKVIDALGGSPILMRYQTSKAGGILSKMFGSGKSSRGEDDVAVPSKPVAAAAPPESPPEPAPPAEPVPQAQPVPVPALETRPVAPGAPPAITELETATTSPQALSRPVRLPPPAKPALREPEDLTRIVDIDQETARQLMQMNYGSYRKIASLTARDITLINDKINSPGRVQREQCIDQARDLLEGRPPRQRLAPTPEQLPTPDLPSEPAPAPVPAEPLTTAAALPEPSDETPAAETAPAERFEDRLQRIGRAKRDAQKAAEARRAVEDVQVADEVSEGGDQAAAQEAAGEDQEDQVLPRPPISRAADKPPRATTESELAPSAPSAPAPAQANEDLTLISGVGETMARDLKVLGYTAYSSLAELSDDDAASLSTRLGFPGRVVREEWREQAQDLMDGKPPRAIVDQEALKRRLMGASQSVPETEPEEEADDLSLISGVGPAIVRLLHHEGVTSYRQILALSDEDAARLDDIIGFPGRVAREEWREQAAELLAGKSPRAKVDQERLEAAEGGIEDSLDAFEDTDLTQIKGIGPALARELKQLGYTSIRHIANLTEEEAATVDDVIGFPGRVMRENWIGQAKDLI